MDIDYDGRCIKNVVDRKFYVWTILSNELFWNFVNLWILKCYNVSLKPNEDTPAINEYWN